MKEIRRMNTVPWNSSNGRQLCRKTLFLIPNCFNRFKRMTKLNFEAQAPANTLCYAQAASAHKLSASHRQTVCLCGKEKFTFRFGAHNGMMDTGRHFTCALRKPPLYAGSAGSVLRVSRHGEPLVEKFALPVRPKDLRDLTPEFHNWCHLYVEIIQKNE